MVPENLGQIAEAEQQRQQELRHKVRVCTAAGCLSAGSGAVKDALQREVADQGLRDCCQVKGVGCMGLCSAGPLVSVESENGSVTYRNVQAEDAAEVIGALDQGAKVERLVCDTTAPFFTRQKKIVLENCGEIDPERIEDYIVKGGYTALLTAITEMTPAAILDQVVKSGLRGRGGAGYPSGLKWSTVAKANGGNKFVVCNGDEGDPGAFMDRAVLESDPHRVLEGMAIAAYAVGANQGYLYVRAEYPLAVKNLKTAIRQAERLGVLGNDIAGTRFSFRVEVRLGAGAFVCGEETALLASVEGKRGTPRPRPPYPAAEGLFGRPTLINNVETYGNVPTLIRHGADWLNKIGTAKSKGTKVFALAGSIVNTGLIEVPMGITLREIVYDIGGGIPDGKKFKAVQSGGPSGGCIPEQHLDLPVDYESLSQVGAMMGSGGMIVIDETSCMVDVAKFFLEFCKSESCGKCVPCRVGTTQLYNLLERITTGEAEPDDLTRLEDLSMVVKATSLCGLGHSAPNGALSTLRYFRDEYEAHVIDKVCPVGVCKIRKEVVA